MARPGATGKNQKHAVHFSSDRMDWETPPELFDRLNKQYGPFDLDAAASAYNAKCRNWIGSLEDAFLVDWGSLAKCIYLNPPYGRGITGKWVKKAFKESQAGCKVVCLLPARTDTKWFHDYCLPYGKIEFLKGRVKFVGAAHSAPFPSMVVVFEAAL